MVRLVEYQIAALVLSDFAGFAGIEVVLAGASGYQFAVFGMLHSLGGSFVGLYLGHGNKFKI